MHHLHEGELLAYGERQLPPDRQAAVKRHLEQCQKCQARLQSLMIEAKDVAHLLQAADPGPLDQPDAERALFHLQTAHTQNWLRRQILMLENMNKRILRQVLIGVAALAVLVGAFSFQPVRALASEFLSLFRVEGFYIVEVDPERAEEIAQAMEGTDAVFGEQEVVESQEPAEAASVDEAAALAGFTPRTAQGYGEPTSIIVTGKQHLRFTPEVETMRQVLALLDVDPMLLPDEMDGQPFEIIAQNGISLAYSDTSGTDVDFAQVPSPTVSVPEGVDLQQLGEVALLMLGMTPEEAARISQSIDWATTLLVPMPGDLFVVREIDVDGVTGLNFEGHRQVNDDGTSTKEQMLVWQKNGFLYMVSTDNGSQFSLSDFVESLN